jgi:arylsulfatase A-like enzyme
MRVPLIASWPAAHSGGRTVADLVDTTDFLPTIAAAAGITLSRDYKPDGPLFLPQIRGERGEPRGWIYSWYAPYGELKHEFAADAQWKLYRTGAFFNTATDPRRRSRSRSHPSGGSSQRCSQIASRARPVQGCAPTRVAQGKAEERRT